MAAILLVILGSSLIMFDFSQYTTSVEMLGYAALVLGFSLLSVDNKKYIVMSCAMCVALFFASLAVDYAFAQRAPDGLVVSFGEYLSNSLDYFIVITLVLSFVVPFITNRAWGSWKMI